VERRVGNCLDERGIGEAYWKEKKKTIILIPYLK